MNVDELEGCLRLLEAYYPGDWPIDRQAVWADVLTDMDAAAARAALKAMATVERWPTIAAFHDAARVPEVPVAYVPEIRQRADRDAVIVHLESARAAIRRAKGEAS